VAGAGQSLLDSLRNASHRLHDLVEALLASAEGIEHEAEVERRPAALSEVIQGVVDGLSSFDAPQPSWRRSDPGRRHRHE